MRCLAALACALSVAVAVELDRPQYICTLPAASPAAAAPAALPRTTASGWLSLR